MSNFLSGEDDPERVDVTAYQNFIRSMNVSSIIPAMC